MIPLFMRKALATIASVVRATASNKYRPSTFVKNAERRSRTTTEAEESSGHRAELATKNSKAKQNGRVSHPQCAEGLVHIRLRWRHAADHQGLTVSPQRVLKHARQLGVSVRHVHLAPLSIVPQRADHVTQRQQPLVDLNTLENEMKHKRTTSLQEMLAGSRTRGVSVLRKVAN